MPPVDAGFLLSAGNPNVILGKRPRRSAAQSGVATEDQVQEFDLEDIEDEHDDDIVDKGESHFTLLIKPFS